MTGINYKKLLILWDGKLQDDTLIIPEKYKDTVRKIAENIDRGLVCYLNPDTLEPENLPKNLDDPEEYELMTDESYEEVHPQWDNCIIVGPPESRESFNIISQGFLINSF